MRIQGVFPVLATPFRANGDLDADGLRRVTRYAIDAGADGVVFPAVASEFYALSDDEREALAEIVTAEAAGRAATVIAVSAPNAPLAARLAAHAERAGASAVMAMAPYVVKDNAAGVRRYFEAIADATRLPIVLQNAPAPLGSAQSVDAVVALARAVPRIEYVKEENLPCGQRITAILNAAPDSLRGVFGGAGGRYIIDELNRGATGTMPACELTEAHVALWRAYQAGRHAEARTLFNRILPTLNFQAVFRMSMTKEVLRRRGVIDSAHVRVGDTPLDAHDLEELTVLLEDIQDLLPPLAPELTARSAS